LKQQFPKETAIESKNIFPCCHFCQAKHINRQLCPSSLSLERDPPKFLQANILTSYMKVAAREIMSQEKKDFTELLC